jgi:hypothetical protein
VPDKTWKAFERDVAKFFGGTRVGGMGDNLKRQSCDVYTDSLLIECKLRKEWPTPAQIKDWLHTVIARAAKEEKSARLCIKIGGRHGFWIVAEPSCLTMWHSSWCEHDND